MSNAHTKIELSYTMFLQLERPLGDFIRGLAGFVIGLPILLIIGLLYLLFSPIARRVWTWRERRLSARMAELGRSISWTKTLEAVDAGLGIIILERWTDYARIWWTPNDVALECPDVLTELRRGAA